MVMTRGFASLPIEVQTVLLKAVVTYDGWSPDNDPWGEHDFGEVRAQGHRAWFKFDYYSSPDMSAGAEDPAADSCFRVLTLLLPEEW